MPNSHRTGRRSVAGGFLAGALAVAGVAVPALVDEAHATEFTPGDVVVYRVGDGSASLSGNAAPVFLDEYTPTGALVRSIAMPTADSGTTHELTASGTAASEGLISLSADGRYLMAPGYHQPLGTSNVSATNAATVARVAGDGTVDTSTVLGTFAAGNNVRGATSTDGTAIWVSGAGGGIGYTTLGSSTSTQLTSENVRDVQVVNGQLYVSSDKDSIGISTVGTGTPTTGAQTLTDLPGKPESGGDPYSYVLLNLSGGSTPDTLYVADATAGQIDKFSLVSGKWKAESNKNISHVTGLAGSVNNGQAVLYATSSGSSGTSGTLSTITDTSGAGANINGSVTTLATAGSKQAFRGVAMAPDANGTLAPQTWPGGSSVSNADGSNPFGNDMSGLYQEGDYASGGVMWAIQDSGKLWRLVPDGAGGWKPDTTNGWTSGKTIQYPGGSGDPDSEGVTVTGAGSGSGVYVSTERDKDHSNTSRLSVLRYTVSGSGTTLAAAQEWNLTADLPPVAANDGLEAVTWVPDTYLTSAGFKDSSTGAAYNPSNYPSHTGGVFFVGVEGTGMVYGYVLEDSGAFKQVAAMSSGMPGVMELQWEPQASRLWVVCDNTCNGQHRTMTIDSTGVFAVTAVYNRPSGMPDYNNEGYSVSGVDECTAGSKPVYWADDSDDSGHALRKGTITC